MKLDNIATSSGTLSCLISGDGTPTLLLHGWAGSSHYWAGAAQALAGNPQLVAPDLPGFGQTPPRELAFLPNLAQTALDLANSLGWQSFAVVGHSLGAHIGLLLAAANPQRVTRLALVSAGVARNPAEQALLAGWSAQFAATTALWWPWLASSRPWLALGQPWRELLLTTPPAPTLLASSVLAGEHRVSPEVMAFGARDLARMDVLSGLQSAAYIASPSLIALAGRITCPTLVLTGKADPLAPPDAAAALATAIPRARLVLLDGCGHIPMAERPAAFYDQLGAFLGEV